MALEFNMNLLALPLIACAGMLAGASDAPIPLGDPKLCLRVLAGLSCETPGEVQFEGKIEGGQFTYVRVLPPMESPDRERVAACIKGNSSYFLPRFVNSKPNGSGIYIYRVTARAEVCPD
jgi:hypothetical protein